jgi:hypothetical protein
MMPRKLKNVHPTMTNSYRIVFESFEPRKPKKTISRTILLEDSISKPTSLFDLSMGLEKQVSLIQGAGDCLLSEKMGMLSVDKTCACCKGKLSKHGNHISTFHDVLTDHKVTMQRLRCSDCMHEAPSTIRTAFNGVESAELMKIQAELGSKHTFRESEDIFKLFSNKKRQINNHDRIKQVVEQVGEALELITKEEVAVLAVEPASELILNVDGGHIKTTEDKRSIEAMTSVIYRPEALEKGETRNYITSKHCAASVRDDDGQQLINNTIVAALKQGLSEKTHITALCDGAANCWKVVEALRPLVSKVTCILDWFHIGMKIQNIALPKAFKDKLTMIKWHLWRGRADRAKIRISELIELVPEEYQDRIDKFLTYINNNEEKIVNYRQRQKEGLVFTSNLAESTVESLINQRCKGHQHMRWSREGLNPLLQIRAAIASNDWDSRWKTAILNAIKTSQSTQEI